MFSLHIKTEYLKLNMKLRNSDNILNNSVFEIPDSSALPNGGGKTFSLCNCLCFHHQIHFDIYVLLKKLFFWKSYFRNVWKFEYFSRFFAITSQKIIAAKFRKMEKMRLDELYIYVDESFPNISTFVSEKPKNAKNSRLCQLRAKYLGSQTFPRHAVCGIKLKI